MQRSILFESRVEAEEAEIWPHKHHLELEADRPDTPDVRPCARLQKVWMLRLRR